MLVIAPIIGIAVFWLVHILPEKIAEKKKHPRPAIQYPLILTLPVPLRLRTRFFYFSACAGGIGFKVLIEKARQFLRGCVVG